MKKLLSVALILCLLSTAAFAAMPEAEKNIYVYDGADVISYEDEGVIFYNNQALEKACGAQIVIATVKNTGSKTTEKYAYELFNKWEVGDKKKDNGFLLLMTIEDDDYYLCEGTGAERIINAGELKLMLNEYLEPDFAKKKYSDGAVKIFEAVFEAVRDHYGINLAFMDEEALTRTGKLGGTAEWDSKPSGAVPDNDVEEGQGIAVLLGIIIVIAIIVAIASRPRRRGAVRTGPTVIVTPSRPVRTTRTYRPRSGSFSGWSSTPRSSGGWSSGSSSRSSGSTSRSSSSGAGRSFSSGSRGGFSGGRGGGGSSRGGGAGRGR